ncbi:MAG: phosphomannomutase/phosphoglucomutase [Cycloclasticus sp.]
MKVIVVKGDLATQDKGKGMIKKVILALMLLTTVGAGAGYFYLGQVEQQDIDEKEQLTARVKIVSSALTEKVKTWQQAIERLVKDPALINSLSQGDKALGKWVEEHQTSMNGLTSLKVVRPGLMQIDANVKPPIGYAGLDLIRRVEESKKIQMPEVHMMGTEDRHITVAAPVLENNKLLAVMLSTFDVSILQKAFVAILENEKGGWLTLKQNGLRLVDHGAPEHQLGLSVGRVTIMGTGWQIEIKKQPLVPIMDKSDLLKYVVAIMFILVIVGVLMTTIIQKDKRKQRAHSVKKSPSKAVKKPADSEEKTNALLATQELGSEEISQVIKESVSESKEDSRGAIFMKDDGIEVVTQTDVPKTIFRAYDIRGIVDETLTEEGVYLIGRAIGSEALSVGQQSLAIARDGRLHSPRLSESLAKGIQATGCDVIDVGQVPTPVLYFATHQLETQSGVMITGSHNPANYNGLKIVVAGNTLSGEAIQQLYQRIQQENFEDGEGDYQEQLLLPEYIGAITADVRLGRMMKVVVDCGNGVAGEAAPMLLSTLGCDVVPLYCEIDGNFPNHHPDPSKPENLQELIDRVHEEEAELGLAFDGDGDRLGVVDSNGNVIWPDRQMMLYAMDVLSRQAGADIIYDVKCTRNLAKVIAKHGGRPVMSKTGHSLIKAKMKETKAELAGEMSGHIFFKERWFGFDDALYTASRLLEILTGEFRTTAEIFAGLPDSVSTPELNISLEEGENFSFVEALQSQAKFEDAKIITIDGVRVEFKDGWGLVRASNTTPSLVIRFEADDEEALGRIKEVFREQMLKINADITLPF